MSSLDTSSTVEAVYTSNAEDLTPLRLIENELIVEKKEGEDAENYSEEELKRFKSLVDSTKEKYDRAAIFLPNPNDKEIYHKLVIGHQLAPPKSDIRGIPISIRENSHNHFKIAFSHEIASKAYALLTAFGYKVYRPDEKNTVIEYHEYLSTKEKRTPSAFDCHCDDEGPVNYPVCSVLFYITNTYKKGCGNLRIYKNGFSDREDLAVDIIDTRVYSCVLLDGQTYHSITPMVGRGHRQLFVVFLRKEEEEEEVIRVKSEDYLHYDEEGDLSEEEEPQEEYTI